MCAAEHFPAKRGKDEPQWGEAERNGAKQRVNQWIQKINKSVKMLLRYL